MADPVVVKLARPAMATTFELLLWGEDGTTLRSIAEEALNEIEELERQLSLFIPTSDVSRINARGAREPVRVEPWLFDLLARAAEITKETKGAFDITAGPLSKCWGFHNGEKACFTGCFRTPDVGEGLRSLPVGSPCTTRGRVQRPAPTATGFASRFGDSLETRVPPDGEIRSALSRVGMDNVLFSQDDRTIRLRQDGVSIDLGGIGKGYAVERAAEIIREYGVPGALIHGGTSTICAIGAPPDREAWPIGILDPMKPGHRLAAAHLKDQALSTSRGEGKFFEVEGKRYGHIIDPRTGRPAEAVLSAIAIGPSPTEADALSTAFAVLDPEETRLYCETHPETGAILIRNNEYGVLPQFMVCGCDRELAQRFGMDAESRGGRPPGPFGEAGCEAVLSAKEPLTQCPIGAR